MVFPTAEEPIMLEELVWRRPTFLRDSLHDGGEGFY